MSQSLSLHVTKRSENGRKAMQVLRKNQQVPAVVYGPEVKSQPLTVHPVEFERIYAQAGESTFIDLTVDDAQPIKVLIHDVQRDPLKHTVSHVDFRQIKMSEKMHAEVELLFEGESPAVKKMGGILMKTLTHIEVECLPNDLPHHIVVDISAIKDFETSIHVRDLTLPTGVTPLTDEENTIASVSAPRSEEELKALDEAVSEDVAAVEVAGEKEKAEEAKKEEAAKETPEKK